jgi:hypothetical protein
MSTIYRDPGEAIEASWGVPDGTILQGRDAQGIYWRVVNYREFMRQREEERQRAAEATREWAKRQAHPPVLPMNSRCTIRNEHKKPCGCYCAVLGRMAPCSWCTDPENDPDREDREDG